MKKNTQGFTLVELMVVIAIIAILAVGSITGYSAYIKKARDNTRVTEIKSVENALTAYVVDNGTVPTGADAAAVTAAVDAAITSVNGKLPTLPNTNATGYEYSECTDTDEFMVRVTFESDSIGAANNDRDPSTANILELGNASLASCGTPVWVAITAAS